MQLAIADDRPHDVSFELVGVVLRLFLPKRAVLIALRLVRLDILGALAAVLAKLRVARGVQVGRERQVLRLQARLERGAGARGRDGLQHGLHRFSAAPCVDFHLECRVHHAVGGHEHVDVGAMEHDARKRRAAISKRAGEVVLLGADGAAMGEQHVAREEARRRVLLSERSDLLERAHRVERELVEVDAGVDLDQRVEVVLGQLIEVGAQRLGERGDVLRL